MASMMWAWSSMPTWVLEYEELKAIKLPHLQILLLFSSRTCVGCYSGMDAVLDTKLQFSLWWRCTLFGIVFGQPGESMLSMECQPRRHYSAFSMLFMGWQWPTTMLEYGPQSATTSINLLMKRNCLSNSQNSTPIAETKSKASSDSTDTS